MKVIMTLYCTELINTGEDTQWKWEQRTDYN